MHIYIYILYSCHITFKFLYLYVTTDRNVIIKNLSIYICTNWSLLSVYVPTNQDTCLYRDRVKKFMCDIKYKQDYLILNEAHIQYFLSTGGTILVLFNLLGVQLNFQNLAFSKKKKKNNNKRGCRGQTTVAYTKVLTYVPIFFFLNG